MSIKQKVLIVINVLLPILIIVFTNNSILSIVIKIIIVLIAILNIFLINCYSVFAKYILNESERVALFKNSIANEYEELNM